MRARRRASFLLAALAALAALYVWRSRRSSEEIARLERIRDELRLKVAEIGQTDPNFREAPPGNVLIGMPIGAATRLVQQVTEGFLDEVELVLGNIRVHKAGSIKAKLGFLTIRPGDYVLDLKIEEAHALLKPGRPKVDFKGNWFGVALPVHLAKGVGRTTLRFKWDSKRMAGLLCDDFEIKKSLSGSVRPRTYDVVGGFELSVREGRLVAVPKFPDPGLVVQVSVEPSDEAWSFVDQVVEDRPAGCRKALKMVDLRKVLTGLLSKGFAVKVPAKVFKPIDLPASLTRAVTIEGKSYALSLKPTGLKLSPQVLWYGADVAVGALMAEEPRAPEPALATSPAAPAQSSAPSPSAPAEVPATTTPTPSAPMPSPSPSPVSSPVSSAPEPSRMSPASAEPSTAASPTPEPTPEPSPVPSATPGPSPTPER